MEMRDGRRGVGGRPIRLTGLLLALGLVLAACGSTPAAGAGGAVAAPTAGMTQTSEDGEVTVKVTWAGPSAGPVFTVTLDTHVVDLDGYDLRRLAVLRVDAGREVRPERWEAPAGGHHREGRLVFPAATADGGPVIGPATRRVELIVRDVAGVPERSFRWTLKQ